MHSNQLPILLLLFVLATIFSISNSTGEIIETSMPNEVLVWDGESGGAYEFGVLTNSQIHSGAWSFEGRPDKWHAAVINLAGTTFYRKDFSIYDNIRFYVKSDVNDGIFNFSVSGWPYGSQNVNLNQYVDGGSIDTSWRLAKIPITVLKKADYSLQTVERLHFWLNGAISKKIYVDDVYVEDTTPNHIINASFISNKVIKLTLRDKFDLTDATNLTRYSLADASLTGNSNITPASVGGLYHVVDFQQESQLR